MTEKAIQRDARRNTADRSKWNLKYVQIIHRKEKKISREIEERK